MAYQAEGSSKRISDEVTQVTARLFPGEQRKPRQQGMLSP